MHSQNGLRFCVELTRCTLVHLNNTIICNIRQSYVRDCIPVITLRTKKNPTRGARRGQESLCTNERLDDSVSGSNEVGEAPRCGDVEIHRTSTAESGFAIQAAPGPGLVSTPLHPGDALAPRPLLPIRRGLLQQHAKQRHRCEKQRKQSERSYCPGWVALRQNKAPGLVGRSSS